MKILLLITKEDIATQQFGEHYMVTTQGGIQLNFTPDAIEELWSDYNGLKEVKKNPDNFQTDPDGRITPKTNEAPV